MVSVMDVRGNSVVNVSVIHMQYDTYCKVSMHAHSTRCYCMLMGVTHQEIVFTNRNAN